VNTSFLQYFPKRFYRQLLPLFPLAIHRFKLDAYDLILSSSHAAAKNVRKHSGQLHICYCHTPMRYAWDLMEEYLAPFGLLKKFAARTLLKQMQKWDFKGSSGVDVFIANSQYVAQRIQRCYGRSSVVIYPPVDVDSIPLQLKKDAFYLTISRLVSYKKIDLIVDCFAQLPDKRCIIIGDGPEMQKIRAKATKNIEILGYVSDALARELMGKAKAFLFAAKEDFGIAPVEAQAAGTPVIAFGAGGVCETVLEGKTGLFFKEQTVSSLIHAIERFEKSDPFDPLVIRSHAETFKTSRFKQELGQFVEKTWKTFNENRDFSRR
jgi:glycosyltransferase involved in cell wall biosynthesis